MVSDAGDFLVALGDYGYYLASTCLDLLDIADDLFVEVVMRSYDHSGEFAVNQGNGAMLHLGSRVSLGMDIGDFLELQSAFERGGEVVTASEIEEIVYVGICLGELLDDGVKFEGLLYVVRVLLFSSAC